MERKYQLDGIRFLLFMMVFVAHHWPHKFEFLGYALPVFFVMSGFLITQILLRIDSNNFIPGLKIFYVRRCIRIFPAYYALVVVLWIVGPMTYPLANFGYFVNISLFVNTLGPDTAEYFSWFSSNWRTESLHLWSLSVEEQFYLVFPILLFLVPIGHRLWLFLSIVFVVIVTRNYFIAVVPTSYYGALISPWEYFAIGALFAWLHQNKKLKNFNSEIGIYLSSIAVLLVVAFEFQMGYKGHFQFVVTNYQTPIAVLLGFFVYSLYQLPNENRLVKALSWKPLVYLGELSYALYLWHLLSWRVYSFLVDKIPMPGKFLSTLIITLLCALASRYLIELPANNYGKRFSYTKKTSADIIPEVKT